MPPITRGHSLRLFMTTDAVGGVWSYALDLARGLTAHRVTTTLVVLGPDPDRRQAGDANAIPGLRLIATGLPLDWTASRPREVEDAGRALADLAEAEETDLVHLNHAALAGTARFHAPLVAVCHSCVATWWEAVRSGPLPADFAWRRALVARGYRAADALIAPTAAFAAATARTYRLDAAPHTVHNGRSVIPHVAIEPAAPASFAFAAGRLWDEGKNLAALDRAARRLRLPVFAAGPLAGPNGVQTAFRHLKPLGRLSEGRLARWLQAAPVFVSVPHYEPFGLAILEAAQAGCALVLSDIPGLHELWDGAALFVPADEDATIAAAIERVAADGSMRIDLARCARERARRYSVRAMAAGTAAVHRSVLPATAVASHGKEAAA